MVDQLPRLGGGGGGGLVIYFVLLEQKTRERRPASMKCVNSRTGTQVYNISLNQIKYNCSRNSITTTGSVTVKR